jgi:ribonuclease R
MDRVMSSSESVTDDDVLNLLGQSRSPLSLREIATALTLRHAGRRSLAKIVSRLKRCGTVKELGGGRYVLAGTSRSTETRKPRSAPAGKTKGVPSPSSGPAAGDPNLLVGRLVAHRDGYGFVVPEAPRRDIDGDLFIPPAQLGEAMHGDRVLARIERHERPRDAAGRAEGRIIRVLDRAHATVVGLFRRGARGNVVLPYESRILQEIIIPPSQELTPELRARQGKQPGQHSGAPFDGAVVDVEITRFPRAGVAPAGRVIEVLGRPDDFGVDVEILIRKHHLPHRFAEDVIEEAQAAARPPGEAEIDGRRDFRDLPIVTIDGETARDFDDAVYVERRPGGWHLQVHIADVAHYVARDSGLDQEARLRGTSVYFPDRAVPMLPEALSNGICSLKPREDRLVMSVLLDLDHDGGVTSAEFAPGVIRSAERMTYTDVNRVLQGDAEAMTRYVPLVERFGAMRDLALLLNAKRTSRGSLDFDLPEPLLVFDAQGQMTGIVRSERNIAHRLIEAFMLAANQAVAQYLEQRGLASLHRVHEKPDPKRVLEFEELAHAFGYSLGVPGLSERSMVVRHGRVAAPGRAGRAGGARQRPIVISLPEAHQFQIRPQHYQRLTEKIAGKPEERILSYLMLRSLKQARYATEMLGHFALAFDEYTHFTSPIRRYPDLVVHRVLKWALAHPSAAAGEAGPYTHGQLAAIAVESSEAERRADMAERELLQWKTARFMEQHLGEEYDALIISVQKFGFFVELLEIFVEGLVPITRLEEDAGERCLYRDRDHSIVAGRGARARIWKLGDRVRVRADRIDPIRRRVEFSLVA